MENKLCLGIITIIISLFLFTGITTSSAVDRTYSIPSIGIDLFLMDDGTVHVTETLHYSFSGTSNEIYRNIPIKDPVKLEKLKISTPGAYSNYTINDKASSKHITIDLYSNPSKTIPISGRDVDVIIEYDLLDLVKFYNDLAQLHYDVVDGGLADDVGQVNARIHLASSEGVKYVFKSQDNSLNSTWDGNTLEFTGKNVIPGRLELMMVIPKSQFTEDPPNVVKVNQDILPELDKMQKEYQDLVNYKTNAYSMIAILLLLACFTPLIIYLIYGRDPEIDYNDEYEMDLPTDDPPAIVNAISGNLWGKEVGEPDMDGFRATIMDLIYRGYLVMDDISPENADVNLRSITFRINEDKDLNELQTFESDIINMFSYFEGEDGLIYLDDIKKNLNSGIVISGNTGSLKDDEFITFREVYNGWKNDLISKFLDEDAMSRVFQKRGDKYLKIFAVISIVTGIVGAFTAVVDPLPAARYVSYSSFILLMVGLVSFIMPQKIAGQWTTYGEEYDAKWHNFAKYIQDFSLIKDQPPESIEIWDKYLVYASALGIATKVRKSMEMILPPDVTGGKAYQFHSSGGYCELSKSLDAGIAGNNQKNSRSR
ncbi:DUF2207 domain-containing protein [Methanobacterium formicicum]|uniref:DUF2207 domain-containing protein n=1 Tax=Methanobacterium formicicum TaxID=2162 RepID=UPI001ED9A485|nr:DUF2207 domain-containing protein [Methanobacterium formicicum]